MILRLQSRLAGPKDQIQKMTAFHFQRARRQTSFRGRCCAEIVQNWLRIWSHGAFLCLLVTDRA